VKKGFNKKVILMILDGFGIAPASPHNAVMNAHTPNYDKLEREYPNVRLKSDGLSVGLPEGQFGTSEVNHLVIGSGKIIFQDLPRINKAIQSGEFLDNSVLNKSVEHAEKNNSSLHLMGICSDGGVHSHLNHLYSIFDLLEKRNFANNVYIHVFTDGRDTAPISAESYFKQMETEIAKHRNLKISIASVQGRFFLDRDRDWSKTEKAVDLVVKGEGKKYSDWQAILNFEYNAHNKDEFFNQYLLNENGLIKKDDSLIFFHYRQDRMYQIIKGIRGLKLQNLLITTFVQGSEEFTDVLVAFPRLIVKDTLAETISKAGKTQLHITETEKFAHLTFFLNGEKEKEFPGETWKMIESNRFVKPNYNFEPTMKIFDITKEVINAVNEDKYDFIAINFCSPDMVGHTGNYNAVVTGIEAIDFCIGKIHEALQDKFDKYAWIITSDHGNADIMWDEVNNQPHTQHTTSPVPFILVSDIKCRLDRKESLQDVAPTILELMSIEKPSVMTGESLVLLEEDKK
jgi:2,3-bisphosphoglycerate-independent phosphoglycerate mutase